MSKRSLVIAVVVIFVAAVMFLQQQRAARLEAQVAGLQREAAAGRLSQEENSRLTQQLKAANDSGDAIERELTRLRRLERTMTQKEKAGSEPGRPTRTQQALDRTEIPEHLSYHYTPEQWSFFVERLDFGKKLGLALNVLAEQNSGQLPLDVTPAAQWLSTNNIQIYGDTGPLHGIGVNSFELVYKGNLTNLGNPEQIIMAREVNPVRIAENLWTRMYVFADGSVNRLEANRADGFADRERDIWPNQPQP